jgi:hypothetical protein
MAQAAAMPNSAPMATPSSAVPSTSPPRCWPRLIAADDSSPWAGAVSDPVAADPSRAMASSRTGSPTATATAASVASPPPHPPTATLLNLGVHRCIDSIGSMDPPDCECGYDDRR